MATNLPLGTYVQDGLRSGPLYTGQVPASLLSFNPTEVLSYSSYNTYGPGVLYSPQYTWNILPNVTTGTGFTALNNLVGPTAAADFTQAGPLKLRQDGAVTKLVGGPVPYVQFDWPRLVTVTITNAVAGNLRVTIFGYDWYGIPLQHTYLVNAVQTYPVITLGNNASLADPDAAKAFYSVTAVYVSGGLAEGSTISLGAADVFGLPYFTADAGDITSIGWGQVSDLNVFVAAQGVKPSGLYAPSSPSDGDKRLRFTYYVQGADAWINQVANAQSIAQMNNQPTVGLPVFPLTPADLYGVPPFYTGNPS